MSPVPEGSIVFYLNVMIPDGCSRFHMVNTDTSKDATGANEILADLVDSMPDVLVASPDDILELDVATEATAGVAAAIEPLSLELNDLLPDEAGEVVLLGGAEVPLSIHAAEAVTAEGIAETHVTASGVDVTGLHYYSFESGITLYSPTDLVIDCTHGVV